MNNSVEGAKHSAQQFSLRSVPRLGMHGVALSSN
jgi:hypothetical protein